MQGLWWAVALLAEGVDRNWIARPCRASGGRSPSSRRAWIEISNQRCKLVTVDVALLAEGVDRNTNSWAKRNEAHAVALLAEGVDRNCICAGVCSHAPEVALLAEGVDRNA